jgi:quercetin dioxygenase-like cupin family protein
MAPPLEGTRLIMKTPHVYFRAYLAALLMLAAVPADAADVKELFAKDLADYPGKEGRMILVSYPPGAQDVLHRHDAHAVVYVLEGRIIMQLKGQPAVTLEAGQTFYEGRATFTSWGAPVLTPVNE